jgi:hypothetical protein
MIQSAASCELAALFCKKSIIFCKRFVNLKTIFTFASDKTKATLFFHQNVILI